MDLPAVEAPPLGEPGPLYPVAGADLLVVAGLHEPEAHRVKSDPADRHKAKIGVAKADRLLAELGADQGDMLEAYLLPRDRPKGGRTLGVYSDQERHPIEGGLHHPARLVGSKACQVGERRIELVAPEGPQVGPRLEVAHLIAQRG